MYFSHPSPYELGGSPDIDAEDAILEDVGIPPYTGSELELVALEDAGPINPEGLERSVKGFSLTCTSYGSRVPESLGDKLSLIVTGGRAAQFEEDFGVKLGIGSRGL